jgi:hypothetical protein
VCAGRARAVFVREVAHAARSLACVVGVACATWGAATVAAHEIGTTQVTVQLDVPRSQGRTYSIDVVTDAEALLEKLDAMAEQPVSPAVGADLAVRVAALEGVFRDRVAVLFDDVAVHPDIHVTVAPRKDDISPPVATIRLSGAVPLGASRFAWRYGWTFASYALGILEDGAAEDGATEDGAVENGAVERAAAATEWLEGGQTSTPYAMGTAARPRVDRLEIAGQYLWLGLTHIVPKGLDHVLFVLGLFLLSRRWRSVLWQVSAFTLAHSVTLGLGMYGLIEAPASVVEPLIAISIAYVALENLFLSELKAWRLALVFAFGLLHGMGFAGVLHELGLPRGEFLAALVGFNVGVEAGQLLVIAMAFALVGWFQAYPTYRRRVVVPASLAIAGVAVYWTVERLPL